MQTQAHKIMANFISRSIHYQQAKGFFTWLENIREQNVKRKFLKTTMVYWMKNGQGKAFRTWVQFALKHKENELSNKLKTRENERRTLTYLKEEEEKTKTAEVEELSKQLQQASHMKDQLKTNFDKALNTHINRIQNNTYVDKRRNIFCVWADYIKKEKNAVNVIGAIARKALRMEVFTRIRQQARENYLDANAEKIITNFARMFKQRLINRYFSKWRQNNYVLVVEEMEMKQE